MIGLLDPALFLNRSVIEVQRELDIVLRTCKQYSISLPPFEEYWPALWVNFGAPFEHSLSPDAKRALHEIRKLGQQSALPPRVLAQMPSRVWKRGFTQLFGQPNFPDSWEESMAAAAIRAVATGEDVILFTRRMLGRNLVHHLAGHSNLEENTRWLLHLQPQGMGHKQILCVYHPRNLANHWTVRFDWRLPGNQHGARYPFCPPNAWWKGATAAWGTVASKHAWLDQHGNGWARPNIPDGAGYHWDVFISSASLQDAVGLDQINVVEYGAPSNEGVAGQIHHVPTVKKGKITGQGWQC